MSHKGFYLDKLENLMKDWPVGSYPVMKSTPRVPGGIPLMTIEYKYIYRKVQGSIATESAGSNEPGNPYLSRFPDIYYDVYVRPVVRPQLLVRYFNACNAIDNHSRMR